MGDPIQPVLARPSSNTTLLARYCKDKVPKTCDHAILQNTSRPCSLVESFVSSGSSLTIEMRMIESTALRQVFTFICFKMLINIIIKLIFNVICNTISDF